MLLTRLNQFRRWAGIDRAVFFSNAAQLVRLVTGPVTMVLVLRHLTPEVQGYFYAFSGVVAMQVFLEMGFSQNILQFASHEFSKLRMNPDGTLDGDPVARSRLISLARLSFGYYAFAAAIFLVVIGIGGHIFFALAERRDLVQHAVDWRGSWWIIAIAAALSLAINPAQSLLSGCNQVAVVSRFGFWQALVLFGVNAVALIAGAGIYASAIGAGCNLLISVAYFLIRWRHFFSQFLERPAAGTVSWRHEIWPFQWRIALSWMSGYFIFDMINPIAFYFCGPVDAGRLGMSLQMVRMIYNVAMTWIYTKAPQFGMLIAAKAWNQFDALWRRSTIQSFVFCLSGMAAFLVAIPLVGTFIPKVPERIAPFGVNAWLVGAMVAQVIIAAMAMELRAYKREPFVWISVLNAILSALFILPLVHVWGIYGEAMGYALAIWVIAIPAYRIYRIKRLEYRVEAEKAPPFLSSDGSRNYTSIASV